MEKVFSILILETDPQRRARLHQLLAEPQTESLGPIAITWAESVVAALSALAGAAYSVMLIGLPLHQTVGEGLTLLRRIRQNHPQLPVIALVHQQETGLGLQAVTLGAFAYFPSEHLTRQFMGQLLAHAAVQHETLRAAQEVGVLEQVALASIPAQVAVLDETGRIVSCNTAWETEAAQTGDPLLAGSGDNLLARCRQHDLTTITSGLEAVLSGKTSKITLEYPLQEAEKLSWYMLCLAPMNWPAGGIVLSRLDITESVEHQIRVSTYGIDLADLKASVSEMTHELRTPLWVMRLHLDLLERMPPDQLAHKQGRSLQVMQEQINVMEQFINDMLALMRLEQSSRRRSWSHLDLNDLVRHVTDTQQQTAAVKGLTLTFIPGELPLIRGNPRQLNQVIINLVANALRYTISGDITVTTGMEPATNRIFLRVEDSGIGIAPENVPHIFERFFRTARAEQTAVRGTGLGLSIVEKIVAEHSGEITVSSELNKGSVFTVWLPSTTIPAA